MRFASLAMASGTLLAALFSSAAFAQAPAGYPSKPITIINTYPAGGPVDIELRLYIGKLKDLIPQPFMQDLRPGAGATIGIGHVAKSAPDGYTLLAAPGNFTIVPAFYKDMGFDTLKDFAPISLLTQKPFVLLTNASFPPKSIGEYVAYAKANPGKINFATSGGGGSGHLIGAWLHSLSKTQATFVHYKGNNAQIADLLSGRVDVMPAALVAAMPLVQSGKVRALALTGDKPSALLPGVQTIAEQGVAGYNYSFWLGLMAPAGTPAPIVNRLSETFAKILREPDVLAALGADGSVAVGSTPAQFRQLIVAETERWTKLVQEAGIKLEQ